MTLKALVKPKRSLGRANDFPTIGYKETNLPQC